MAVYKEEKENAQIDLAVKLTGLTKQDYITRRLLCKDVVVQGNPRVYKALRYSTAVKIFLPCLFSLFLGGSCLVLRVELSVEHGIQLLLQALSDFFIEIVLTVQVVKHQIDE